MSQAKKRTVGAPKLSFLIAAHNEEGIIKKTLQNLINLPHDNYEVIIGLDGCTDGTEKIIKEFIKKSNKIKYYKLNLRSGKPAVINSIIKKADGDIIIINDADWIFRAKSPEKLKRFLSIFDDKNVGGIAESFPVEWNESLKKSNLGYKMVAYSTYLWMNFQKKKYGQVINGIMYVKNPEMFMTNIFRKKLYRKNTLLGDDFERTIQIVREGYKIAVFEDENIPRMTAAYHRISIKDLFKQKVRTAKAREQLKDRGSGVGLKYYFSSVTYILLNSLKYGLFVFLLMCFWTVLTSIATLKSKIINFDTREGWRLRVRR